MNFKNRNYSILCINFLYFNLIKNINKNSNKDENKLKFLED